MDPMTMALLGKLALGGGQMIASALGKNKRPKYQIPDSQKENLALARLRAADVSMPGEQQAVDRAELAQANSIRAAQEGGNAQESLAGINAGTQQALGDIGARKEAYRSNQLDKLGSELKANADYQDQAFQLNEYAPYAMKQQMKAQMFGAGVQNIMGGLDQYGLNSALNTAMGQATPAAQLGSTATGAEYPGKANVDFGMNGLAAILKMMGTQLP